MGSVRPYRYRALSRTGEVVLGVEHAQSPERARDVLADRGILPITVEDASFGISWRRTRLQDRDLALVLRGLAVAHGAGVPLASALLALPALVPAAAAPQLNDLSQRIAEGEALSQALDSVVDGMTSDVHGLIVAGERAGTLGAVLIEAARVLEDRLALRTAIRGALAYPAVLLAAVLAVTVLMVHVVLPRFAEVLADLGASLPHSTTIVLAAARAAQLLVVPTILIAVATWAWLSHLRQSTAGRRRIHAALLRLPIVGSLRLASASARTTRLLASGVSARITVSEALMLAAAAAPDAAMGERLSRAHALVVAGVAVSSALAQTDALTPTAVRLLGMGELAGRLPDSLEQAARLDAAAVDATLRRVVALLQPALIVLLGGLITCVAIALLQAVYSVRPHV
jgi:general secretion pathway protein F